MIENVHEQQKQQEPRIRENEKVEITPVILTSWPWRANRRSESGEEWRKRSRAALRLNERMFHSTKATTVADRKRNNRKKMTL